MRREVSPAGKEKAAGRGVGRTQSGESPIDQKQARLFANEPSPTKAEVKVKPLRYPIWTESKAQLIQSYLRLFTFITKHGTYIDAFAGPQAADKIETWSAKLVLESQPRRLRNFHLFEQDKGKVKALQALIATDARPSEKPRKLNVYAGDCNVEIPKLLAAHPIRAKEATFALLDQRTFECHWETVRLLATHKTGTNKIELFYFLPNAWLPRSLAGLTRRPEIAERWWGRDGPPPLG